MIQKVLERFFGRHANVYLAREIRLLGHDSIKYMNDETKIKLVNNIMNHLFSDILSRQKQKMIQSELLKKIELSKSSYQSLSNNAQYKYEISKHLI